MDTTVTVPAIHSFLRELKTRGLSLIRENDSLILRGKEGLTDTEIESVKKDQKIISYIRKNKQRLLELIPLLQDKETLPSGQIVSIYRLSGLQEGILFHSLYEEGSTAYIEQFGCELQGINPEWLLEGWQWVMGRHSILRSGFYYEAFRIPVQCVWEEVKLPVALEDLRGLGEQEQREAISRYEEADRKKGFILEEAPLMRVSLLRLEDGRWRMLWTFHHLLLDGWSVAVVLDELREAYGKLASGGVLATVEEDRYEEYIRYIEGRDREEEEGWWRKYLSGLERPVLLPFGERGVMRTKGVGSYGQELLRVDRATYDRLQQYGRREGVTMNTLLQGVWAYLLYRYTGEEDIVYGVTVSGRPEGMTGVERRVGMYINTLPLRVIINETEELGEWLRALQSQQVESRQYQYSRLNEVQQWGGMRGDWFDNILVFENYPVGRGGEGGEGWRLQMEGGQVEEHSNYLLTLTIGGWDDLWIAFSYNKGLLEEGYVRQLRDHCGSLLEQLAGGEVRRIGELRLPVEVAVEEEVSYPTDKTIVDLLEEASESYRDREAVVMGERRMGYE